MTRQAFLAQMPDPLSFRPLGIFLSSLPFSPTVSPLARSRSCSSVPPSLRSLPLQKSRAIALGGLSTLTDSRSHIAETRARSTMFGTFTTDKPKANLYALIP